MFVSKKNKNKVVLFVVIFSFLMGNAFPQDINKKQELSKEQYEKIAKIITNLKAGSFIGSVGSVVGKTGSIIGKIIKEILLIGGSATLGTVTTGMIFTGSANFDSSMRLIEKIIGESAQAITDADAEKLITMLVIHGGILILSSVGYYLIFKIVFNSLFASKNKAQNKDQAVSKLENFMAKWATLRSNAPKKLKEIFEPVYVKYKLNKNKLNLTKEEAEKVLEQALSVCLSETE